MEMMLQGNEAMKKKCYKCGRIKTRSEFYKDASAYDLLQSMCKECQREAGHIWESRNRERRNELMRKWRRNNIIKYRKSKINERKNNLLKAKARDFVKYAIWSGRIIRMPCEVCFNPVSQAHHDNYNQPLKIRWLCVEHHSELHNRLRDLKCQKSI